MDLKVFGSKLAGTVEVPPSKSHSIRAIILASFAQGRSTIINALNSQDVISTINCMQSLGVKFIKKDCTEASFTLEVIPPRNGLVDYLSTVKETIIKVDAGNSGSLLYFMAMIICFIPNKTVVFTGDDSLSARPITPILEAYNQLGVKYETTGGHDWSLPLKLTTSDCFANNQSDECSIELNLDGKFSQVVSGVLMAAGIFGFSLFLKLARVGEKPYLKMTCTWLENIGIEFEILNFNEGVFKIGAGKKISNVEKQISADWSSASFVIGATVITNSQVAIQNLTLNDSQGDSKIVEILNNMGANIQSEDNLLVIKKCVQLNGTSIDCATIPDLVPILALVACFAKCKTELLNAEICRFKECDRLSVTCSELLKLGANITENKGGITIHGGNKLKPACVYSHKDHRIAMMLAIAGLTIDSIEPVVISDCDCFNISFPNFISVMKDLGANFIRS